METISIAALIINAIANIIYSYKMRKMGVLLYSFKWAIIFNIIGFAMSYYIVTVWLQWYWIATISCALVIAAYILLYFLYKKTQGYNYCKSLDVWIKITTPGDNDMQF